LFLGRNSTTDIKQTNNDSNLFEINSTNNNNKLMNNSNQKNNLCLTIEKHIKDNSYRINSNLTIKEIKNRKNLLKKVKNSAKNLNLQVINNSLLKKGMNIIITCEGIKNQLNNKLKRNDGFVYFGAYPNNENIPLDENNYEIIDFNLYSNTFFNNFNNENNNFDENNKGRHFLIEYSLEKNIYIIKDLGVGYGTFVRLDYTLNLKDNMLINIGQIYVLIHISNFFEYNDSQNNNSNNNNSLNSQKPNQLKLIIYGINYNEETFYYKPINNNITIGRYQLANIHLNDKLLSQIHCTINYSEKEGWLLTDGQINKPSTNGTWLYINDEYNIYDKMIFKTGQIMFQATYINNDNNM